MNRNIKNIAAVVFFALLGTSAIAQVSQQKIGQNPLTINPNAALEIESSNKGLLLPRLELQATNLATPLTAHERGMVVYNTASAGTDVTAVTPGYYYNDGTKWVRIATGADAKTEPWFVQNSSNEATANTDDIYQQGKVAVGFTDADGISDKKLEVKGDFKTEFVDTDDYVYGFQTAIPGLDPATKENLMYVADNEDMSAANHLSFLGMNKNNVSFISQDKTGAQEKSAVITAANIPGASGGLVGMTSETSTGKYASLGGITWTETVEAVMQTRQTVAGEDIEMDLLVRPKTGISFKHQGPTGYGAYTFPTNSPTEGQVLVGSATSEQVPIGRRLEWKDVSDLVKAAMPKFFYMPSIIVPTSEEQLNATGAGKVTGDAFNDATRQGTIQLHTRYAEQFGLTGTAQASSTGAPALPILPADELHYYVTWYDINVFETVSVSNTGVLTYTVKSDADITIGSFMNIVFAVKED